MLPSDMNTLETYALDLLRSRQKHWSLPQAFYSEEAFFDLDMKHMFGRQWLFVALSCEVPNPGDWITVDVGRDNIIVLRDNDRQIRAFHNSCRHRGSRICLEQHGKSKRLVCPYHQWTYDLTGELIRTRYMEGDFDRKDFGLAKVHCENLEGYVFICLADEAPPFEKFRADLGPYIKRQDIENAKIAYTQTLVEKANWKLVIENNRECYHCSANHPELLRTLAEFDDVTDPRVDPRYVELIARKTADWDAHGVPYGPTEPNIRYRAVRLPFIDGHQSMTMDGKLACTKLMSDFTDYDLGSVRMLSLPNNWNHLLSDHMMAFRVMPVSAQETHVVTKWLVHKDAVEGVDYDVERLTTVWKATNEQDKELAEWNQQGINSSRYKPGPYSAVIEMGVRDFIQWYTDEIEVSLCRTLGLPPPAVSVAPTERAVYAAAASRAAANAGEAPAAPAE